MTEPRLIRNAPWAEELTKRAVEMWRTGLSSSHIAHVIGRSRSAVMGKVHRMGLRREDQQVTVNGTTGKASAVQPHTPLIQQATKRYKQKKRAPWSDVAEIKPELTPTAVHIVDLEAHHCRWPVSGEGADMMYCGGDAMNGLPYCARHCRLAFRGTAG